jgi:hypothetical protein
MKHHEMPWSWNTSAFTWSLLHERESPTGVAWCLCVDRVAQYRWLRQEQQPAVLLPNHGSAKHHAAPTPAWNNCCCEGQGSRLAEQSVHLSLGRPADPSLRCLLTPRPFRPLLAHPAARVVPKAATVGNATTWRSTSERPTNSRVSSGKRSIAPAWLS